MGVFLILAISISYIGLLFGIAFWAERRSRQGRSLVNNPYVYALSLAVYCTAWTYYGSVGRAATSGIGFLPIYLGPSITAPLWLLVLRKIILISKAQRITSIADFISSRYGKSTWIGAIATVIAVAAIIPYISIQLKAITISFEILVANEATVSAQTRYGGNLLRDTSFYVALTLAVFSILFGTRRLDPQERHEGLVAAIAFESVFKLIAFLAVGAFVVFGLFDGFEDLFSQAFQRFEIIRLLQFEEAGLDAWNWFWLMFLSMSAILFLPRQFHVGVVENFSTDHLRKASWIFPLYLLLINIFVLPIAFAGLLTFGSADVDPDTFVLALPLSAGKPFVALLTALGGFSAATSMVIVAVIALSIMLNNHILVPLLVRYTQFQDWSPSGGYRQLILLRRLCILLVLFAAYLYLITVGQGYTLVSIGLISFTGIAQFVPVLLGGLYWKKGTKTGAIAGLVTGFAVWSFTMLLPTLAEVGLLSKQFIFEGLFGIGFLRPYALFGMSGMDHISHSAFWSLLLNTAVYGWVSLRTRQSPLEMVQADYFVEVYKYQKEGLDNDLLRRQARVSDVQVLLFRFLGADQAGQVLQAFERQYGKRLDELQVADADLVNFAERHLSGALGAASAKVLMASIAKEEPISLEEMFRVLEQTREILEYSRALEKKSNELEQMTRQLQVANQQLQELDRLKADFITTITHELRTPITSIKAFSGILLDNRDLPEQKRREFLEIIIRESARVGRLINQVLDLEKLRSSAGQWTPGPVDLSEIGRQAFWGMESLLQEKSIEATLETPEDPVWVEGLSDKLMQVLVNLLSNAIKFADRRAGKVALRVWQEGDFARVRVADNGIGIAPEDQSVIFQQFIQLQHKEKGKPSGSGLGLFISRQIIDQHQGRIWVESKPDQGAVFYVEIPLLKGGIP